jgi:hypothetical protein
LVEGSAVNADTQVRAGGERQPDTGPRQHKTHSARPQGGQAEGDHERQQQLIGGGQPDELNKGLCRRVPKNAIGHRQHRKKWQHRADTDDLRQRGKNHEAQQQSKLATTPAADVMPEAIQLAGDVLGSLH